eukprot:CAMPEP_0175858806 /NCGR_PEP_ID=MMETSP0107_2-20121207/29875_1 /TAXON_ID=195067 ORGANISM="Goniomonas pacifica, Strain CCMP1869" /NCGR_SAMPLE_ID=MMETSP0107_2 /ASSEMBLY_ACC=CAM_ASM_000203 /LENGTH=277 /DNA_ID=CAMNT_0017175297 /DNA_START=9 /DNA_END=842 /DNA_ORIENTATION=+
MSAPYQAVPMRDLSGARSAYETRDVAASVAAHANKGHEESHSKTGGYLKSIVYGGLDGIITTFAVVSGASGGGVGIQAILILGFSNIFADGLSMGVGDALSSKAENEYINKEKAREMWEYEHNKQGEIEEMVDLYESRGMSREDAETVMPILAKNQEFFIDLMLVEELGLQPPDEDDNPWKDGLVTFCSFVFFGLFPLLGYAIFATTIPDPDFLFVIAICLTAIMLFILGSLKSRFSQQHWLKGGVEVLGLGGSTAVVAYLIGWLVATLVGEPGSMA